MTTKDDVTRKLEQDPVPLPYSEHDMNHGKMITWLTEVKNSLPTEIQILRKLAFENGAANAYYNMLAEQEKRSE
jgi:hypothetical protein